MGPVGRNEAGNGHGPAAHESAGLLAAARGGTLFLQNVASLPFATQVKLCDALGEGDRDWPGLPGACPPPLRVIAATREDLKTAVAENRFYSGLYYLLAVVPIHIPPLRQRREDIRPLAEYFLAAVSRAWGLGDSPPEFSEQAWECLLAAELPGNARQLAGVVARAMAISGGGPIPRECVAELLLPGTGPHPAGDTLCLPMVGGLRAMEALDHRGSDSPLPREQGGCRANPGIAPADLVPHARRRRPDAGGPAARRRGGRLKHEIRNPKSQANPKCKTQMFQSNNLRCCVPRARAFQ